MKILTAKMEWPLLFRLLMVCRFLLSLLVGCFLLSFTLSSSSDDDEGIIISPFSGKPVPRFESLRYSTVNGRNGPSQRHPVVWRYQKRGLPVLIIKESHDWRRVRDPYGDEVWIRNTQLSSTNHVILKRASELRDGNAIIAILEQGVVAELHECGVGWCEISVDRFRGVVLADDVWGWDLFEKPKFRLRIYR